MRRYLRHHRAQQFTINGFTYPFVNELHFAALPYPIQRKYSMLAGLYASRPGDLFFMFQSDPQWPDGAINSRRGLRGVYRVVSEPFADDQVIQLANGYSMLGACPACGTHHASLSRECVECSQPYPAFPIPPPLRGDPYRILNTHLRLEVEPLVVFDRAVSDERAYGDMSDPQMIWIGRHDNAMGIGKGSSIRQLLPEEAAKIVRLALSETGQHVTAASKVPYPHRRLPILNEDGTPAEHLRVARPRRGVVEVQHELMLNFDISRTIDVAGSSIQTALGAYFSQGDLEYFSTEFPWGYTASTSDFVCTFAREGARYRIVVMEFKRGEAGDGAVVQVSLYVPWVVQVLTQFADPEVRDLQVVPAVIGRKLEPTTCVPAQYSYRPNFQSGASPDVSVERPLCLEYTLHDIYVHPPTSIEYAQEVHYHDRSEIFASRTVAWTPPPGTATSQVERDWVAATSWAAARTAAGF